MLEFSILENFDDIYTDIAAGKIPSRTQLVKLLQDNPEKLTQAIQAKALIDIIVIDDDINFADSKEEIQKLSLKLTHSRFLAERLLPKIFGSRQQIEITETTPVAETEMAKIIASARKKIKQKELS
jgi:hypothetical protein